jgi:hypothetical protein
MDMIRTAAFGGLATPPSLCTERIGVRMTGRTMRNAHVKRPGREEERVAAGRGAMLGESFEVKEFTYVGRSRS